MATGSWNAKLSDSSDVVLKAQGVNWLMRKVITMATVTLIVTQTKDASGNILLDIENKPSGGMPGAVEKRVLNWEPVELNHTLFGNIAAARASSRSTRSRTSGSRAAGRRAPRRCSTSRRSTSIQRASSRSRCSALSRSRVSGTRRVACSSPPRALIRMLRLPSSTTTSAPARSPSKKGER
uniref:LCCL-domain containing protein n=1 Tax=Beauveria bassiana TaxID=176275 RepID=A0A8G0BLR8_BEABA|nr:LCCL-domain containing protein [Beauveria bassiana]